MKIYKWVGTGHFLGATIIVVADCMKSATEGYEMPTGASITKIKRVKRS